MKDIFLLDLDDTLVDFPRAEERNFFETLSAVGVQASGELYGRFHLINDALWRALERGEMTREILKVRRFELLFREFGIEADAQRASDFYYRNFEGICYPFDGAAEFLRELSARGRVYLVTNGGARIQHSHVRLAGFGGYLSGMFISEEIGCEKPERAFAEFVETHIEGYERERAVWIGDSLTSDMLCAKTVGIDFILYFPRPMPKPYDGLKVRSYLEILNKLFPNDFS